MDAHQQTRATIVISIIYSKNEHGHYDYALFNITGNCTKETLWLGNVMSWKN